ncbi:MAG: ABC transporter ATP-binding protein [Flavobacteriales bacterium]
MSAPNDIVMRAEGVGKRYRLGVTDRRQFIDEFKAFTYKLRGKADPTRSLDAMGSQRIGEDFWALRDVSFEVRHGEVLGIIGRNGAGKSTLLKLLSRITQPTEGVISMRGKVSSLLEVGTGFHPELSGRDNIYLNGAILGMRKTEVDAKLNDIISFSGIEHHIDTPVKRYSSGMRVRLGFAVAAHLEPEVLIVDEVLSVGDADFQRKSMGKMKDSANSGRTVLFVSHNMTAMRSLCSRVIWLENGRVRMQGPTEEVVAAYLGNNSSSATEKTWGEEDAPGSEVGRLRHVRVAPASGGELFLWEDAIDVEITFEKLVDEPVYLVIWVYNSDNMEIVNTNIRESLSEADTLISGTHVAVCQFPSHLFNSGDLILSIGMAHNGRMSFKLDNVVSFTVVEPPRTGTWHGRRQGMLQLQLPWKVR